MGKESSVRIQTSLLNNVEKKLLVWLANRQPKWVTSDFLTYVGLLGAVLCAVGFILSNIHIEFLWLSSFGLVVNWYGDSLDRTVARVRKASRPQYGFFIDHSLDSITVTIMCVGAGLSPMFRFDVALLVLTGYLVLSIYTYICTIVKNEFRLTYGKFGPTEFRLLIIIINTIFIYTHWQNLNFHLKNQTFGICDISGIIIAACLFIMWFCQFVKDRKIFSKSDPLK